MMIRNGRQTDAGSSLFAASRTKTIRTRWGEKRYYSLDCYLKERFGEKVYRLSLNAGLTCPNRDGTLDTRGCIFCSRGGSGDFATPSDGSIYAQIEAAKQQVAAKSRCRKFIAYFQAYTNTYGPISYLRRVFQEAASHPDIVALSVATRPDCLPQEALSLLGELCQKKPVWVELGLQSIHEATGRFIRRGFSLPCFEDAFMRLHTMNIPVIVHVILGLPGETKEQMLETVDYLAHLGIEGIKLQMLHILSDTDLADIYRSRSFPLFSREEYCDFIVTCLERLPPDVVIHRLTGDGPKNLLIAPLWSCGKKQVLNRIQNLMRTKDTWQGKYFSP